MRHRPKTLAGRLIGALTAVALAATGAVATAPAAMAADPDPGLIPTIEYFRPDQTFGRGPLGAIRINVPSKWQKGYATRKWLRDGVEDSEGSDVIYLSEADGGVTFSGRYSPKPEEAAVNPTATGPVTSVPYTVPLWKFNAPKPQVTGATAEGDTLTGAAGSWAPTLTALPRTKPELQYQWLRNGEAIAGATGLKYTLLRTDLGKNIQFQVIGSAKYYETATALSDVVKVPLAPLTAPIPLITGTPAVGNELTAAPGTWQPAHTQLKYQWLRNGEALEGETAPIYRITWADLGAEFSVRVTGSATADYEIKSVTSEPTKVPLLPVTAPVPTITGSTVVGEKLTAAAGTWKPAQLELSYQWLRDGTAIAGATGQTYTLTAADPGTEISVRVTGSATYYEKSVTSAATKVPLLTGPVPKITGSAVVGENLTAVPGAWQPVHPTLTYQWLRGDTAIAGATGREYTVTVQDLDAQISVRVTASAVGYASQSMTSAATEVPLITGPIPKITGTPTADGIGLLAAPGAWHPQDVTLSYQWFINGDKVAGADLRRFYIPKGTPGGSSVTVEVTGEKAGYTKATYRSAPVTVLNTFKSDEFKVVDDTTGAELDPYEPTSQVGRTLSAQPDGWGTTGVNFTYQWLRHTAAGGSAKIPGATSATYTLTNADAGHSVSLTAIGTKAGYLSQQGSSAEVEVAPLAKLTPATPKITGTGAVGKKLSVNAGSWKPSGVSFTYQWLRGGKAIAGATKSSYTLTKSDAGARVSVTVTGSKIGYVTASKASAALNVAKQLTPATPKISGTAKVGKKLAASAGSWKPSGVSLKYQWLRNGKAISKATKSTYTLTKSDAGKKISLKITGSKAGYATETRTSKATAAVKK